MQGNECPEGTFYDESYSWEDDWGSKNEINPIQVAGIYIPKQGELDEAKCVYPMRNEEFDYYNTYGLNWNDGQELCKKFAPKSPNCPEWLVKMVQILTNQYFQYWNACYDSHRGTKRFDK